MENIKSEFFLEKIFFQLETKRKLKLVKYNKNLQNIIGINLTNYKIFSGKNIIYETYTKGKEYNNYECLIYEGEFSNGERNGKGKEFYSDGKLKFEGEYLKGKRWNVKGYDDCEGNLINELKGGKGFIKEYNEKGILFEGEYLNGKKNGKGKEYKYGHLIFEGEYLNGCRYNGKGYNINNDAIFELKNGKGFIKEYNKEGILRFEGEYLNGKKNGKGIVLCLRKIRI